MLDYRKYTANDFALDTDFRKWILHPSPELSAFWEKWLAENPDQTEKIQLAKNIVLAIRNAQDEISEEEIAEAVAKIVDAAEERKILKVDFWRTPLFRRLSIAASLLLVAAFAWLINAKFTKHDSPIYQEAVAQISEKNEIIETENNSDHTQLITLSDGSTVILQPKSKLSYPEKFIGEKRQVVLSGEAFFEVAKNANQPFFVFANEVVAKVLGTSFTIKAFESDKNVQVFVKSGKVSVFTQKDAKSESYKERKDLQGILILPNQQVTFIRPKWQFAKPEVLSVPQIVALPSIQRENFVFKRIPVNEVFATLEKSYGIEIIYDKNLMASCQLTAELGDEPLFEKINLICKVIEATYTEKDGQIFIEGKGCN